MKKPYIPSITINNTFYHGTAIYKQDEVFSRFSFNGDWDGIWFTDDKEIAISFGDNWSNSDNNVYVFEVKIKAHKIANIGYDLFTDLKEYYEIEDFRELIPILKDMGFNGWKTIGSIDTKVYDDYCLFYTHIPQIVKTELLQLANK